jgi:hypothetical protein
LQKRVASFDGADVAQAQLLHQPVLKRLVGALNATLGRTRVRADDVDVELAQARPNCV